MKADGLENVRTEPVMVPRWVRGHERAELAPGVTAGAEDADREFMHGSCIVIHLGVKSREGGEEGLRD